MPYYIGFSIVYAQSAVIDDVSTSGIVGVNNAFTELDSEFQTSYTTYAKYANPASTYQQRVRSFANGSIINTTTLTGCSGFIVYNRLAVFGTNYGYYQIYTTKDGILEATHNILYGPSVSVGSVSMDKDTYAISDNIVATYSLITPDYVTYDYKAYLVRLSDYSQVASQSITSDSGTKTFDTSTYTADTYYVFLARTTGGTQQDFAYDFADLNDVVNINGITYNAESGAVLGSVNVNDSQGATWFNATSNASAGIYNLTGISVSGIDLNINASIASYTHTNWTYSPLAGGTQTVNLYLIPTAPTFTGTAILGLVGSYPWHQAINGATINIWNSTWNSSTTASATGYYIFNSLTNSSTYSMNASMSGYTTSSDVSVAVVNDSFQTQNFVLVPGYVLTVTAKDSVTGAFLSSFTTTISGISTATTTGSTTHSLDYGLYTISVSAADHYAASTNILLDEDQTVNLELMPVGAGSTIFKVLPHDVKFVVQDIFGTTYPGVTVTVQGYNTTTGSGWDILASLLGMDFNTTPINSASMSGVTGSDGAIVFKMSETIYYNINVTSTNPTISNTFWLYPKDDLYYLTVSATDATWNDYSTPMSTGIVTGVAKGTFNASSAWINVTYNDSLLQTTSLIIYVNQSNTTGGLKQVNIASWVCSTGCNATSKNFTIAGYNGQSYIVNIRFVHTTYGTNTKSYAAIFPKSVTATGIPQIAFLISAVLIMVFVGAIFTYSTAELGLLVTCGLGWIFWLIGWFDSSNTTSIAIGLTLGTFISIVAYISKQSEKGRYT